MTCLIVLIISNYPLLCEGLGRLLQEGLLEQELSLTVVTVSDEASIDSLGTEVEPDIVVVVRPDTRACEPTLFSKWQKKPEKVVILGWDDDKLAVYHRPEVLQATVDNLVKVIGGNQL